MAQPAQTRDLALRLLGDPVRRAAYELVAARGREMSRLEVAGALDISRTLAAFHLDRLAEAGLLLVSQRRLGGRAGPGAGRPSKLYRRARPDLDLLIPPRRYDLAATLLADAVARVGGEPEVQRLARGLGRRLGGEVGGDRYLAGGDEGGEGGGDLARGDGGGEAGTQPSDQPPLRRVLRLLRRLGYLPRVEAGEIHLSNCPFHAIAEENAPVVCGMNHACLEGLVEACGADLAVTMEPLPGDCCVVLLPAPAREAL